MEQTVVALFREVPDAEQAIRELLKAGFDAGAVSAIAHREKYRVSSGGEASVLTDLVDVTISGIGPLAAAGPMARELTERKAGTAEAMLSHLTEQGVPDEDAGCFCEALRRGGVLVSVSTSEEKAEDAERILGAHRVVDIEDCSEHWRAEGWKGFESSDEPAGDEERLKGLPFDPDSIRPSVRRQRRARYGARRYIRIR